MKKKPVFNPFKNLVLDKYEQEIEDALNKGIIKPLPNSVYPTKPLPAVFSTNTPTFN